MQVTVLIWLWSSRSRAHTVASDPEHLCGSTRVILFKAQVLGVFGVLSILRVMEASFLEVAEVTNFLGHGAVLLRKHHSRAVNALCP